jgi:tetratricopeptide (TPR) repeat protein
MAQVLLCRDERLGREVAVKRLHADSPEDVERRFAREARLGAALNHPNLVSVFDTAVDDNGVLIVMEYVEGEPLSRALRRGPLEPLRVAAMARDLGAALDHAHAHNVVHRDVKPGNVLLRRDGITKLADLGIATAVDLTRITRSGELLGTAAYMAPEQLDGLEPRPASDVYALAAVCFEALAGVRPRRGRSAVEIAHRIATEPPPDLRDRLPLAQAGAAEALSRGMARDPGERTASAGELADELATALEGGKRPPRPAPQPAPTRRLPRVDPLPLGRQPAAPASKVLTPARPAARGPRRKATALIPLALLAVVTGVVAVLLLSGGGSDGEPKSQQAAGQRQSADRGAARETSAERAVKPKKARKPKKVDAQAPAAQTPATPVTPEPAESQPATGGTASAAELNDQGFALMQRGDYAAAVPLLQQAVAAWPSNSRDIGYAYALYNLGKSLNRAGRASEAIPYLEKRLNWDDQRATVQAELDLARQNAGQG